MLAVLLNLSKTDKNTSLNFSLSNFIVAQRPNVAPQIYPQNKNINFMINSSLFL